ncbi:hypothetical protein [Neochlamydia sp. AcF95]|uniref:hypothetical protein n=1 Tax=Neochlamydia sp. AcF95 TaxID=2795734 RepID=UPI001BC96DD2|nr:hypothetical protein [Neochlamydia sp. AcF95]MBS4170065.1 Uncharacterized protein [Neochlamydia sp. AcF95]
MSNYFARSYFFYLPLCVMIGLFYSCAAYKYPTERYYVEPPGLLKQEEKILYDTYHSQASSHWLYYLIPRHRSQIYWFDLGHWCTWALFGNDDHGLFAEAQLPLFKPCRPTSFFKAFAWMVRNPLHNFCHYVIGNAGCVNDEFTLLKINKNHFSCLHYEPIARTVFAGRYTSFYLGLHGGKPLISLRLSYGSKWKSDFYIGWRERGNFGIKFLPLTKNSLVVWENLPYEDAE